MGGRHNTGSLEDELSEITFLTRSATRTHIFKQLYDAGAQEKHELRRQFDCDRTTLQRNLKALIDHGWVQDRNGTYRITPAGELLAAGLFEFIDTVDAAMELKPFLRWMPDDAFDFDITHLPDADIFVSDPSHPDRVIYRHTRVLKGADLFRGFVPFIGRQSLETVWGRVMEGQGRFEVVVPTENIEILQSEHAEMVDELAGTDRVVLFVTDVEIPYYLGIVDGLVQIGNRTDTGMRRAMLETEHPDVRAWAEDTYAEHKQQASKLRPDQISVYG